MENNTAAPKRQKRVLLFLWRILIDFIAALTFSFITSGLVIELIIAGMTWGEMLGSRLANTPLRMATAPIFRWCRDWWLKLLSPLNLQSHWLKMYVADTFFYGLYFSWQYGLILYFVIGITDPYQLARATVSVIVLAPFLGRPYGAYQAWLHEKLCLKDE